MDDAQQLREVYQALAPAVYRHTLCIVRNPADAEDVLQQVFVRVALDPRRPTEAGHWRPYLFKIATRLSLNHVRHRAVRSGDGAQHALRLAETTAPGPEDAVAAREILGLLAPMCDGLDESIVGASAEGETDQAMARRFGVNRKTIYRRLRALQERVERMFRGNEP